MLSLYEDFEVLEGLEVVVIKEDLYIRDLRFDRVFARLSPFTLNRCCNGCNRGYSRLLGYDLTRKFVYSVFD